jgi:hypothetical protein
MARDLSWYPRRKYLYNNREVLKVEMDIRKDIFGSVCCWTVSDLSGGRQIGQAQRGVFSGFLKANNILPAWLDDGKDPAELAEEWGFININASMHHDMHVNGGHACFVPKEDPQLLPELDPAKIKVFSLHIASALGCLPVIINAIDLSGEGFELSFHDLETPIRSVALAIKKKRSLPADVTIKLVTPAGQLLQDADMLSKAMDAPNSTAECHVAASLEVQSDISMQTDAEVRDTVARFMESLCRRKGDRTDLGPPAIMPELLEAAIAEERASLAPAVEAALWEIVRVLRFQEALALMDTVERELAEEKRASVGQDPSLS